MKKSLLVLFMLSLAFAGCEKKTPDPKVEPSAADRAEAAIRSAAAKTKAAAIDAKDAIHAKMIDWKLTPADLKTDFEKGGRIVRTKASVAGARTGEVLDNARVVTVINAKLVGDNQLSALKINVDANQGVVTLKGTVTSLDLIGRAISLALDTDGVTEVVSLLTVSM